MFVQKLCFVTLVAAECRLDNIKEAIELLLDVLQDDLKDKLALSTTQIARIEIAHVS
ncbi:MAG: hypothetical protein BWY45_01360 [Euryarchaeota archaeon ADurb.Bin294]|nr:MAG: hypothetical protein BWY45_01360 [Euryarchaeota archaeon ADurb.Bin294]